jgi:colanic acid biosynthesis glycosyl transferase WcaI
MKILLVCVQYPPEVGSGSKLVYDLAVWLRSREHSVSVLTCVPKSKLSTEDSETRWSEAPVDETGVSVLRVDVMPMTKIGYVRRGLATLLAPLQMVRAARRYNLVGFDAVFVYSPPLTFGIIGAYFKRFGARFVFNVQDVFPQNAIDLGVLRNSILIGLFRRLERWVYAKADVVTVHSPGNADFIRATSRSSLAKVVVLDNWIDSQSIRPSARRNFRKEYGLEGKVVALFAGVIGPSQGVVSVVRAMARVKDVEDFVLLVVGDGSGRVDAVKAAEELLLTNVLFKPFISQDDYPDLLASVDIGVVSLSAEVKTPVVPGKLLGYMAAALPVAAFVNERSDVFPLVKSSGCGLACLSDDTVAVSGLLRSLASDESLRQVLGSAGRSYAEQHFSIDAVGVNIEKLIGG